MAVQLIIAYSNINNFLEYFAVFCGKWISRRSSKHYHVSSQKIANHQVLYQCHLRHVYSRKITEKRLNQRRSINHHFQPNHVHSFSLKYFMLKCSSVDFLMFFWILVYEDDQPPNSAISTATPPAVVGNRFFGPDFNIEQVKGMCISIEYSIHEASIDCIRSQIIYQTNSLIPIFGFISFRLEYERNRTFTTYTANTATIDWQCK